MCAEIQTQFTQFLTFHLDEESYALDISRVHSVLDFEKVTKVPQTPDYMRGVINLRGAVVPIIDLKCKFGMGETRKTLDSCVIIVEVDVDGETTVLGALADSVHEVIDLSNEQIEPAPKIGTRLNTDFIKGMGKKEEEFIIILDLDKVFTTAELTGFQGASVDNVTEQEEVVEAEVAEAMA
jgi:purine-binding chemotaxis protein CheW